MAKPQITLATIFQTNLDCPLAQLRAVPVREDPAAQERLLLVYSSAPNNDPWFRNIHFSSDTLKFALITHTGEVVWKKDLGPGVVPGVWFFPFFPFDLDGDGVDELYILNNLNPEKPLDSTKYVLQRLALSNGEVTGQWPWPHGDMPGYLPMSHSYRYFILGRYAHGINRCWSQLRERRVKCIYRAGVPTYRNGGFTIYQVIPLEDGPAIPQ